MFRDLCYNKNYELMIFNLKIFTLNILKYNSDIIFTLFILFIIRPYF